MALRPDTALRLRGDDSQVEVARAVLVRADVGIAMEVAGSEVVLQAADMALLSDDMGRLALAHRLARQIARVIQLNLRFALGAMAVVLNGLRLLRDPIRGG